MPAWKRYRKEVINLSENKRYYWLRLMSDFFTQPKMKKLRRIAGGDTYTIIYLKMQLLSLKNDGNLFFEGIEEDFAKEIALTIDEDEENVRVTIQYLISQNLLEEVSENEFLLTETQTLIGSESGSKERVRAFRERKKIRENIPLIMVKKVSPEQIVLPDGKSKFIDNKRYGGNAEYVYELAMCKCENCGESDSSKLVIHHNNGYSNDLEDLYLLCRECHANVENGNIENLKHNRKSVTCNANVTACNTEIEKEIEIDKEKDIELEVENRERVNYQQVADMYNNTCVSFPRLTKLSESRKKAIKARLKNYSISDFQKIFEMAEESDFLKGKNDRNWQANFDWLLKDANMAKVLDGNYQNRGGNSGSSIADEWQNV